MSPEALVVAVRDRARLAEESARRVEAQVVALEVALAALRLRVHGLERCIRRP